MKPGKDGYYRSSFRWDGKTYTVAGKTEAEVYRKIGKKKADLESGKRSQRRVTVRDYAKQWLATYHPDNVWYGNAVKHIVDDLGRKYMTDITEATLQTFLNKKAETYSKSYIMRIRLTLGQMFRKARKNHIIPDDPAEDLTIPPCKEGHRRAITGEERQTILTVTENHRGRLFVRLMLYCGLRPQEASVLQWKHIDLKNNVLHIRQARKHDSGEIGAPKSASGIRDIPIPKTLRTELHPGDPEAFVCSWKSGYLTAKNVADMWQSIKKAGSLPDDLDLYCLRHTYCTDLQKAGVPINIAKELMGHSSIQITANIYTHTGSDDTKKAVEKLDKHLARPQVIHAKFGT